MLHKKSVTYFLGVVFVFFVIFGFVFSYLLFKKSSYIHEKGVIVERTDAEYVCALLKDKNISSSKITTKSIIKILKIFGYRLKMGEYSFSNSVSLMDALKIISSGKSIVHKFTIPEGFSVFQVINKLNNNEFLLGKIEKIPEEGSLMPDTYLFKYPTAKQQIITQAQGAMRKFLEKEWPKRSGNCIAKTPYEALILASIVEKETYLEREIVAGVYTKRLRINMRMQAEPTAVYAIAKGSPLGREITRPELRAQLPHNTYKNNGLPPTPISNPSRASIIAALHPAETDNLFFVLDETGYGHFAKTYKEHKQNIAMIRAKALSKKINDKH